MFLMANLISPEQHMVDQMNMLPVVLVLWREAKLDWYKKETTNKLAKQQLKGKLKKMQHFQNLMWQRGLFEDAFL